MSEQVFTLPSPGKVAIVFPLFIGVVVPAAVAFAMAFATGDPKDLVPAGTAVAVLPLVALLLAWDMHHRRVELRDDGLQVRRWPWPKRAALAEFDLAQARVADLDAEPALRPRLKIAGSRLPGYSSGWFWLKDRRRAYVLRTSGRQALVLPRRDGTLWLLGVERVDALLAALRARS